ncbi:S8/S53 family peptidase [Hymenobacter sp. 15J16-1T3B]|uniref:S8 family peptidase n=1 Tax=Hymenobacter sp. 15J16-1T3B TaxID=2886941 RepID=UPI001D12B260|nr:S8/S53 family peptidase [Hymenobacter sp. 15J16-1T3B]MCC3157049.1 S8/S53 family peptidase [Hymenobacter sp. 15J16-1T3B]
MPKFTLYPAAALLLWLGACQSADQELSQLQPEPALAGEALTAAQLDEQIWTRVRQTGAYDWRQATDHVVWSALQRSDQVLSVGYAPAGRGGQDAPLPNNATADPAYQQARQQVLELILAAERAAHPDVTADNLVVFPQATLPVLTVRVRELATVQALRRSPLVRYAEPMGYEPYHPDGVANRTTASLSSSGCGNNTATAGLVAGSDYAVLSNGSKSSWNQADAYHGIRAAWTQSTGSGVKLVIIDTGSSDQQENLGAAFNQGLSAGRSVERLVTLPRNSIFGIPYGAAETPNDQCGHGTSMAGAAAAPRGTDGASVGIAYNANLITIRAAEDVFIDASREVQGIADAYTLAANRPDVRIISMSMGRVTSSSQLADAIRYAYGRGKLIFCAAGTSFDWSAGWVGVIFPASMAEAVAVTGVKDNLTTRCDECHVGSDVEFTVVMQRSSNNLRPLSLAMSGDAPSTVGGSSVSTASMAAMAAVVWSKYPTETREQIKARLVAASSNATSRDPNFGYGRLNLARAVGALVQ